MTGHSRQYLGVGRVSGVEVGVSVAVEVKVGLSEGNGSWVGMVEARLIAVTVTVVMTDEVGSSVLFSEVKTGCVACPSMDKLLPEFN